MAAPSSVDEFLAIVAKSDLIPADQFEEYVSKRRLEKKLPAEPIKLAQAMVLDGKLTKYQAEQLLMGRWRNFIVAGKYKLLERLGRGGMAMVFLCEHRLMKRLVALKILPAAHASDRELLGRFHREARALSSLRHPNIVGAHDVDNAGQLHFLVMEYVDGGDLEFMVRKNGPFDVERACHYIRQAAEGLQHAHEVGLVHRDIKPGNLLVDRAGTIKLLDLGLARIFHETTDDLTTGRDAKTLLGTVDYLAPEQAINSHEVDIRADIYSLGATFYFLLAGRGLFEDGSVAQKLSWHLHRPPQPLHEINPDIPPEIEAIVDKMLAKSPDDRFQTPQEVVEALEPWTQRPIDPPLPSELPALSRAARSAVPPASSVHRMVIPRSTSQSTTTYPTAKSTTTRPGEPPRTSVEPGNALPRPGIRTVVEPAPDGRPRGAGLGTLVSMRTVIFGAVAASLGIFTLWAFFGPNKPEPSLGPNNLAPRTNNVAPGAVPTAPTAPTAPVAENREIPPATAPLPIGPAAGNDAPADVVISLVSGGASKGYPSLKESLRNAKPGDKVTVRGSLLREILELSTIEGLSRDLTIESTNPDKSPVRWSPPANFSKSRALLELVGVEGLKIKGFLFDGKREVADLVRLSGRSAGTTFEDVQFRGATRAAVVVRGSSGESERPLAFHRNRFQTDDESEAAILFEPDPDRPTEPARSIVVRACRFVGPYQAAITFAGAALDIDIHSCRFFRSTDGVRYKRTDLRAPLGVKLVNNTFVELSRGIHFETTPPSSTSSIVVTNNLFCQTQRLAHLDRVTVQPSRIFGAWVWTNEDRKNASVPPGERVFRKAFELKGVPEVCRLDIGCDETFTVWVNGTLVFKNPSPHFTQRVFMFDVAKMLRPGKNVIAVLGVNDLDRIDPKFGTTAGLLAQVVAREGGKDVVLLKTDSSWKWNAAATNGWNLPSFDDTTWAATKPWNEANYPWTQSVWDSEVLPQLKSPLEPIVPIASGNIRDYKSWDGYPTLDSERGVVPDTMLPKDPSDDATFLRYPKTHALAAAAAGDAPVGAVDPD